MFKKWGEGFHISGDTKRVNWEKNVFPFFPNWGRQVCKWKNIITQPYRNIFKKCNIPCWFSKASHSMWQFPLQTSTYGQYLSLDTYHYLGIGMNLILITLGLVWISFSSISTDMCTYFIIVMAKNSHYLKMYPSCIQRPCNSQMWHCLKVQTMHWYLVHMNEPRLTWWNGMRQLFIGWGNSH